MGDTLDVFGIEYTDVAGIKAYDDNENLLAYIRPQGNIAITENTASIDVAEYATASVSVAGGATNMVTGEFTASTTTGAAMDVTVPYTGTGYPIAALIYIKEGLTDTSTTWYSKVQRYAIGQWSYTKADTSTAPTWATSGSANYGVATSWYKSSTSNATSLSRAGGTTANTLTSSSGEASASSTAAVKFKGNGKTLSVFVASTSYGLLAGATYKYVILYSS